ncbi:hypothetical protein FD755_005984, partial [Muntiacus reevesi]
FHFHSLSTAMPGSLFLNKFHHCRSVIVYSNVFLYFPSNPLPNPLVYLCGPQRATIYFQNITGQTITPKYKESSTFRKEEMMLSGKYKSGEKILHLANERFVVPEILFNPSDIGIHEMRIPEAINIVLTGGNSLFPGFRDRVYSEVRCLTPIDYDVSVVLPENLLLNDNFDDMVVTREDYEENGHSICEEKFDI